MATTKQKVGLVAQYRDMAYARLSRIAKMMQETSEQLSDPNMEEYLPQDFKRVTSDLYNDSIKYVNFAESLRTPPTQ